MQILLATGNAHKATEFTRILNCTEISVTPFGDFDVIENGKTFAENAAIKAREVFRLTGKPAIADDSGICVDALGGAPGIFSARYTDGTDHDRKLYLLSQMDGKSDRNAHYTCAICYIDESGTEKIFEAEMHGTIAETPIDGGHGFGYDPIFIPDGFDTTVACLDDKTKDALSHRGKAIKLFKEALK